MSRYAHFNVFVAGYGYHEAAWKVSPDGTQGLPPLAHFIDVARIAERGVLDSLFFADSPGVALFRARFMSQAGYDPIDLLAALIPTTEHIGLLATASTTYSKPWDLARRFATLDHLSGGRAGWNVVTTSNPLAALNFGETAHPEHGDRYSRAEEFVDVVLEVWDGWEDDAVVASPTTGLWADVAKLHPPMHDGEHYSVAGILPLPRAPQGYPVLAQAGSSDAGVALAGRIADVVFTPQSSIETSIAFRQRVRAQAESNGRSGDDVRLLPGLSIVLGETQQEADAAWRELEDASSPEFQLHNLCYIAGVATELVDDIDPDGPFPFHVFESAASQTFADAVMTAAREGGLTFRQAAGKFSTLPGGLHFTGTPVGLADLISTWMDADAADGFTLQPLRLPRDLELFVDHVVPILQERGITRTAYSGGTLRDELGLPRPPRGDRRSA